MKFYTFFYSLFYTTAENIKLVGINQGQQPILLSKVIKNLKLTAIQVKSSNWLIFKCFIIKSMITDLSVTWFFYIGKIYLPYLWYGINLWTSFKRQFKKQKNIEVLLFCRHKRNEVFWCKFFFKHRITQSL